MQKKLAILIVVPMYVYALYNPFFIESPTGKPQFQVQKVASAPPPPRKNIDVSYFGFIESNKGTYALISFNGKNIIVQPNDSLYHDEQIYKVGEITSNYIFLKDQFGRIETVYFSSESRTQ